MKKDAAAGGHLIVAIFTFFAVAVTSCYTVSMIILRDVVVAIVARSYATYNKVHATATKTHIFNRILLVALAAIKSNFHCRFLFLFLSFSTMSDPLQQCFVLDIVVAEPQITHNDRQLDGPFQSQQHGCRSPHLHFIVLGHVLN